MALQQRSFVCDGEVYPHYYLCNYVPFATGSDKLSYSLIRFKRGEQIDMQAWTDCATDEIQKMVFPSKSIVLRALASHELRVQYVSSSPLDKLAFSVSSSIGARYRPYLLRKRKTHQPLKSLHLQDRIQTMGNLYTFQLKGLIGSILLLDDIFTSGATMTAIIRSIRKKIACPIVLFTLATTDLVSNTGASLSGVGYSWNPMQGWLMAQEPPEFYYRVEHLKNLIEADFQ
jgi:hypothetical protein